MIGHRLSQEEAKSGQFARVSTANCARSPCEKVFEDILAIHSGERLFTNFAVQQTSWGTGVPPLHAPPCSARYISSI
jgi:hypothetical protein